MSLRHTQTAFTLIEMLLALTLTAVLLTIISVTIGAVARDNQRLESMRAEPLWLESVVEVLRRDLRQSDAYQMTDGGLTLHSHTGNPGEGNLSDHDSVTIEYEVLGLKGAYWLVRRVAAVNASPTNKPTVELLCGGVKDWDIAIQHDEEDVLTPGRGRRATIATRLLDPSTMSPIPNQVAVSFTLVPPKTTQLSARNDASPPDSPPGSRSDTNPLNQEHLIIIR